MCAAAAAGLTLAGCGDDGDREGEQADGPPQPRTIDRARDTGERPAAKAAGSVRDPLAIAIRVSAAPKQRVAVVWALSCTSGDDDKATTRGGSYTTTAPNIRPLELPAGASGEVCAVDATARIPTGRVKTTLLATAP